MEDQLIQNVHLILRATGSFGMIGSDTSYILYKRGNNT